jgi:hypothetical protein
MMKKAYMLLISFIVAVFAIQGVIAAGENDAVVARIGDRKITESEFNSWLRYSLRPGQDLEDIDNKYKASMLHQIVTGIVISDIARKERFDQRPKVRQRLKLAENNFLTLHYLNEVVAAKITASDEAIKKYYEENTREFKGKDGKPRPLPEVRELIVNKLAREKRREAVDVFVKEAMKKADAEVDVRALVGNDPHFQ